MTHISRMAFVLFAAAGLSACGGLRFTDDVDLTLDFFPFVPFATSDQLHTPYVQGADVTAYVRRWQGDRPMTGAWAESSDENVFEVLEVAFIDDGETLQIQGRATGPGEADLLVYHSDGDLWDTATVEVGFPTRAELHASGPMFVDLDGSTEDPRVLVDGTATFQVRYFDGEEQLWGNGTLSIDADPALAAETDRTFLFENREWVRVTPEALGSHELDVYVDGTFLQTVAFEAVDAAAVDGVRIFGRDESGAEADDWLVLLAQSYDTAGERIYGVEYQWEIDGIGQFGEGDLYRYQYDPDHEADVVAEFDGHVAQVTANVGAGYVDSSNNIGCNGLGALPGGFGALLWALPAVLRRRRTPG